MKTMNREITYGLVEDGPIADPACPLALNILARPPTDLGLLEVKAGKGEGGIVSRVHYVAELFECLHPLFLKVTLSFAFEGFEDVEKEPIMHC
jgi:hypothetical protein